MSDGARAPRLRAWSCAIVAAVVLALTLRRYFLGVDFSDEATYVALPYRFLLGDKPFVDEVNPIQTAAFFTLPIVWAWRSATGGLEGIVLVLRLLYFATLVATALFAARRFTRELGPVAALVVLPLVACLPLGTPTFSYNTLASGFFTLGLLLLLGATRGDDREDARWRPWLLAGVVHAWSAVALATYALASAAAFVVAWAVLARERRAQKLAAYALGGVLALALFLPVLRNVSRETLAFGYAYTGGSEHWLAKLGEIQDKGWKLLPHRAWIGALVAAFLVLGMLGRRLPALVAFAAAVFLLDPKRGAIDSSLHANFVALLAPIVAPFAWRAPLAKQVFLVVWLPSTVAALVASWTSGNGVVNAGFGALPGAVATMFLAASYGREGGGRASELRAALVPLAFLAALLVEQRQVYSDDPAPALVARMDDGPFRGLYTTPEKKAWIDEASSAIRGAAEGRRRIVAVIHFPLAYLLGDLRPATRNVWGLTCPPRKDWDCEERFVGDLIHFAERDLLVVELRRLHYSSTEIVEQGVGAVAHAVRVHFRPSLELDSLTLFVAP